MRIRKAVFPVAGLGTRFLPATKASAKEILPVVDKPLIQYAVKEAIAAGGKVRLVHDAEAGVEGVDAVVADTWVSMGDEEAERRHNLLMPYQVTEKLMARANKDAIFLHCLPAHRGEEVVADVIDGPQSLIWDEAENRIHGQKSVLLWALGKL